MERAHQQQQQPKRERGRTEKVYTYRPTNPQDRLSTAGRTSPRSYVPSAICIVQTRTERSQTVQFGHRPPGLLQQERGKQAASEVQYLSLTAIACGSIALRTAAQLSSGSQGCGSERMSACVRCAVLCLLHQKRTAGRPTPLDMYVHVHPSCKRWKRAKEESASW